ncbi:PE domain-containing protein [Mycobacterium pseudokansasii]|uniref:PE domain-containing protein n=1 Tax=Mycobacterium pseudokansasii TaxID=2341080 RepID=UPI0007B5148F|nr:PE domain-containing protein [Mycobacterium pseudokansasii]KZS67533.1 hypothetical protein A4G27_13130 [Mycobacterium kansasii]VBA34062.1 hypothetical protein LAUMK35_05667 [Mycobacterium pseudokansasii]VBA35538.1 hypothetical protein LAUMK21_05627 [Mycobacterium pseudokansasii]
MSLLLASPAALAAAAVDLIGVGASLGSANAAAAPMAAILAAGADEASASLFSEAYHNQFVRPLHASADAYALAEAANASTHR